MECLQSDLVIFTISEYLPGEYAIRVLPLLCKATRAKRLSLSLLGGCPTNTTMTRTGTKVFNYLEGPIYGVYSIWRDFQKVILCGHAITGLRAENEGLLGKPLLEKDTRKMITGLKRLHLPSTPLLFPFHSFSRLTELAISLTATNSDVINSIWRLPLISLTISGDDQHVAYDDRGPPAFMHTLRSLCVKQNMLHMFAFDCRKLQELSCEDYHPIIAENPQLTSLSLSNTSPWGSRTKNVPMDFTRLTRLVKLDVSGTRPFFSNDVHNDLTFVSFFQLNPDSTQFLLRCPALRHISLRGSWSDIVPILKALDPSKYEQQLTLRLEQVSIPYPSFDEVDKLVLKRGFRITDDLLLWVNNGYNQWSKIVDATPAVKNLRVFDNTLPSGFITRPEIFPHFHSLSVIEVNSSLRWTQRRLTTFTTSCPMLKVFSLRVSSSFISGALELESQSLCKLKLRFLSGLPGITSLKLPSLTHLSLYLTNEGSFLPRLLDGDSSIDVPLLRVVALQIERRDNEFNRQSVLCRTGHPSLTHLTVEGGQKLQIPILTLRKLPHLRSVTLRPLLPVVQVQLDIPGDCDVIFGCERSSSDFTRLGCCQSDNFTTTMFFNQSTMQWIQGSRNK